MLVGLVKVEVLPFPKFHVKLVPFVEVLVKFIKPPLQIGFGCAVNDTDGFENTVIDLLTESLHPFAFSAISFTL